jgi:hypothetical protein
MLDSVSCYLASLFGAGSLPLDDGPLSALGVACVVSIVAIGVGLGIAARLARRRPGSPAAHPQTPCRLHEWLQLDDGGFVCVQCSYRAGSS